MLWNVISILLLVHLLLLVGAVAWLRADGRLNRERVQRVVDMLRLTIDEESQQTAEAVRLEQEITEQKAEAARQERIASGPATMADRLSERAEAREVAQLHAERAQRNVQDLQRQIELAKEVITRQKAELDAARATFEAEVAKREKLETDEDFRQAVALLEQLKPRQAKEQFQTLIEQGKTDQVIDYLSAMQLRKSAAVLREFRTEPEIDQATTLIERLRERGVDLGGRDAGARRSQPVGVSG